MTTTRSNEGYLKAIWELDQDGRGVRRRRIAERLRVSAPAVTVAVRRLGEDGLAEATRAGVVRLTARGRRVVQRLLLRHNLVERLLVERIGIGWADAHEEAERIEHAISDKVERRLLDLFGRDGRCPHGAPLREETLPERRRRGLKPLSECAAGDRVTVEVVCESDRELLCYLETKGVLPGTRGQVDSHGYDDVIALRLDDREVHLGGRVADRLWVRLEPPEPAQTR